MEIYSPFSLLGKKDLVTQNALALFMPDKSHTNTMTECYDSKQSANELHTPKQIFFWELNVLTFAVSLQLACIAKGRAIKFMLAVKSFPSTCLI